MILTGYLRVTSLKPIGMLDLSPLDSDGVCSSDTAPAERGGAHAESLINDQGSRRKTPARHCETCGKVLGNASKTETCQACKSSRKCSNCSTTLSISAKGTLCLRCSAAAKAEAYRAAHPCPRCGAGLGPNNRSGICGECAAADKLEARQIDKALSADQRTEAMQLRAAARQEARRLREEVRAARMTEQREQARRNGPVNRRHGPPCPPDVRERLRAERQSRRVELVLPCSGCAIGRTTRHNTSGLCASCRPRVLNFVPCITEGCESMVHRRRVSGLCLTCHRQRRRVEAVRRQRTCSTCPATISANNASGLCSKCITEAARQSKRMRVRLDGHVPPFKRIGSCSHGTGPSCWVCAVDEARLRDEADAKLLAEYPLDEPADGSYSRMKRRWMAVMEHGTTVPCSCGAPIDRDGPWVLGVSGGARHWYCEIAMRLAEEVEAA